MLNTDKIKQKLDAAREEQEEVRQMHSVLDKAGELDRLPHSYKKNKPNRFTPAQVLGIPGYASVGEFDYQVHATEVREAYSDYMEEQHGDVEEGGFPYQDRENGEIEVLDIQTEESRLN